VTGSIRLNKLRAARSAVTAASWDNSRSGQIWDAVCGKRCYPLGGVINQFHNDVNMASLELAKRKMNTDSQKVMFRTRTEFITARLEFERGRAFAVLYEYGPKGTKEVIKSERLELDVQFLEKINSNLGADFLYQKEVELPNPDKN
jgi:hypothetical protein